MSDVATHFSSSSEFKDMRTSIPVACSFTCVPRWQVGEESTDDKRGPQSANPQ